MFVHIAGSGKTVNDTQHIANGAHTLQSPRSQWFAFHTLSRSSPRSCQLEEQSLADYRYAGMYHCSQSKSIHNLCVPCGDWSQLSLAYGIRSHISHVSDAIVIGAVFIVIDGVVHSFVSLIFSIRHSTFVSRRHVPSINLFFTMFISIVSYASTAAPTDRETDTHEMIEKYDVGVRCECVWAESDAIRHMSAI